MNTKKQQCIKDAYGTHWAIVQKDVNEDGWIQSKDDKPIFVPSIGKLEVNANDDTLYRPKSLQGIETNNNWISIESEDDLPKEYGWYWVVDSDGDVVQMEYYPFYKSFTSEDVTHYQDLVEPSKPHY